MIFEIVIVAVIVYVVALCISLTFSCGGYSFSDCGLCPIGIIQLPLDFVDWIITKVKVKGK